MVHFLEVIIALDLLLAPHEVVYREHVSNGMRIILVMKSYLLGSR